MNTPAITLPQLEESIRAMLVQTGVAEVALDTFLAAVETTAGKTRWTLSEIIERTADNLRAVFVVNDPPNVDGGFVRPRQVIRFRMGIHGRSADVKMDEFAAS